MPFEPTRMASDCSQAPKLYTYAAWGAVRTGAQLCHWPEARIFRLPVPAVISSVSDRDPAALREMTRLGLKPGVGITVETGTRNASLRVRIGDRTDSLRLSQTLASGI